MSIPVPMVQNDANNNEGVYLKFQSLNYIKQLGLKDTLCLKCGFMMETLRSHKYDTPLARVVHWGGPHAF